MFLTDQKILEEYEPDELPDFIFCAGDDVTDEDMFIEVSSYKGASVFTCVVGMKPTNADYYLRNSHEVRTHPQKSLGAWRRRQARDSR